MSTLPLTGDKDSAATLDYVLDLASKTNGTGDQDYLVTSETIQTINYVNATGTGLVINSSSIINSGTQVEIWISGGTTGTEYIVTTNFTTSLSRIDERSFRLRIRDF